MTMSESMLRIEIARKNAGRSILHWMPGALVQNTEMGLHWKIMTRIWRMRVSMAPENKATHCELLTQAIPQHVTIPVIVQIGIRIDVYWNILQYKARIEYLT